MALYKALGLRRNDTLLLKEQYRSLTRLMPNMYGVIFAVTLTLVVIFYQSVPAWIAFPVPALLTVVVIIRTWHWLGARQRVEAMTSDQQLNAIKGTTFLGAGISFGFSLVGLMLMNYGSPTQQALALIMIWAVAVVSAFCLHSVLAAAIGVVLAATVPLTIAFLVSTNPTVGKLVPIIVMMTVLIMIVLMELHNGFAKLVRSSESAAQNEALALHAAHHDPLTGLPNRALLAKRLEAMLARKRDEGRAFAVHCIDLDRFKEVNETFGHEVGDELLRRVSQQFTKACGPTDILARIGGDEFVLVQDAEDAAAAESLAAQIISTMSMPISLESGRVFVGCSIGIYLVDDLTIDPLECLRRADLALYQAKHDGRQRLMFFDESIDDAQRAKQVLRDELRDALLHEELSVVYQQQVRDDCTVGVEALVRWSTRERGAISPSIFVPIAEESGLIDTLGNFVIRRAFLDSRKMKGLRISVNISAAQIRMHDFIEKVQSIAIETDVDPKLVELEITEGLLLGQDPEIRQSLDRLRSLGFRIVLDDFGTGYSSLGYLHQYPIDKIKIDRIFVLNMGPDAKDDAVVNAIVGMARALNIEVIAEGVESVAQHARLVAAGCRDFQGFHFGRPMQLEALLRELDLQTAVRRSCGCPTIPKKEVNIV
jgi:diguanylate cyclase (GGDEF)-like protein